MKITLTEYPDSKEMRWEADFKSLPGSPPVGRGKTKSEAIGNLIQLFSSKRNRESYPVFSELIPEIEGV